MGSKREDKNPSIRRLGQPDPSRWPRVEEPKESGCLFDQPIPCELPPEELTVQPQGIKGSPQEEPMIREDGTGDLQAGGGIPQAVEQQSREKTWNITLTEKLDQLSRNLKEGWQKGIALTESTWQRWRSKDWRQAWHNGVAYWHSLDLKTVKADIRKWWSHQGRTPGRRLVTRAGLSLGVIALVWYMTTAGSVYAVMVDGHKVAVTKDKEVAQAVLQELMDEKSAAMSQTVKPVGIIDYKRISSKDEEVLDSDDLKDRLEQTISFATSGTAIVINGEQKLVVRDQAEAEAIINQIITSYQQVPEGQAVEGYEILDQVEYVEVEAKPEDLVSRTKALSLIQNGTDQVVKYRVKEGDSLWSIARANDMLVEELKNANPQLKSERLSINQELNLVKSQPMVRVVTTITTTVNEEVPFPVKVTQDDSMWRGQEKVQKRGVKGQKEVTYRIVKENGTQVEQTILEEKVLSEPVPQEVIRGSKILMASRGDGGNGQLAWPARGQITSGYGYRGREFHPAIDIDGNTGDPVGSAEAGTVIEAGWNGGYGRTVVIDHGDGVTTRYAHLSQIEVGIGQEVGRGDLIGLIGSTGRSTGSHLHFEVRINGSSQNPRNYLR